MIQRLHILVIFICATLPLLGAGARDVTATSLFGARDAAMGGASLTSVDDASSILINPSRMPVVAGSGFYAAYYYDALTTGFNSHKTIGGFVFQGGETYREWAFGLGARTSFRLDIPQYSIDNEQTGTLTYGDMIFTPAFAFTIRETHLIGIGANVIYTHLSADDHAFGGGLNIAYTTSLILEGLRLAIMLDNLGGLYTGSASQSVFMNLDNHLVLGIGFNDGSGRFAAGIKLSYAIPSGERNISLGGEFRLIEFKRNTGDDGGYEVDSDVSEETYAVEENLDFGDMYEFEEEDFPLPSGLFIRLGFNNLSPSVGVGLALWHARFDYALYTDSFSIRRINHALSASVLF